MFKFKLHLIFRLRLHSVRIEINAGNKDFSKALIAKGL